MTPQASPSRLKASRLSLNAMPGLSHEYLPKLTLLSRRDHFRRKNDVQPESLMIEREIEASLTDRQLRGLTLFDRSADFLSLFRF